MLLFVSRMKRLPSVLNEEKVQITRIPHLLKLLLFRYMGSGKRILTCHPLQPMYYLYKFLVLIKRLFFIIRA
jgi:hypothetical protein